MRVLLVAGLADSLINFRGPLISAIQARGMEVHVAAPGLDKVSLTREKLQEKKVFVHQVPIQRTGINPLSDLVALWVLFCLMRKIQPDVVLTYTIKPVIYGSLAAWLARVPRRFALITGLGYSFIGDARGIHAVVRMLAIALYSLALRCTKKVFFQNSDDQELFMRLGLLGSNNPSLVVNGSGVDLARFPWTPMPESGIQFLLISRMLLNKGVREYAQAAQYIKKHYPKVRFVLVGPLDESPDGIQQSEVDAWIKNGAIEYLGPILDVRPAIKESNIYVLPSYREGIPRTVLEAMSMGRAIITTDSPGCRETVIDGSNGFLIPIKSVTSLIGAMKRFIDDPLLAQRMGIVSRKIAEEKYDVHKVNEIMLREMNL